MANKVSIPLVVKNSRSCLGCTKCCEGWLSANIYGHDMYPGKACTFLGEARCCSIYDDRPEDPCKKFFCMWRLDLDVPEEFSPNKTGTIFTYQHDGGMKYLTAAFAGKEITQEMISWLLDYHKKTGMNVEWTTNGTYNHVGSPEFLQLMIKRYSN